MIKKHRQYKFASTLLAQFSTEGVQTTAYTYEEIQTPLFNSSPNPCVVWNYQTWTTPLCLMARKHALRHQQSKMSSFLLCHNMWIFESTIRQPKTCDSYKDTDSTFQLLSKSLVCVKLSNLDYPLMPYGPKTRLTAPTIQNAIMPSSPQNVWFAQPLA